MEVRREAVVPGSAEEVWAALTEPPLLSAWFGAEVTLDAREGGRADFRFPDGTSRGALIESLEPRRRLTFRWLPFERGPDGTVWRRDSTTVDISLSPAEDGTLVTIVESSLISVRS